MKEPIFVGRPSGARPFPPSPPPSVHHDHVWMPVGQPYSRSTKPPSTLFVVQNTDPVAVTFLLWQTSSMPLSLVILLSAFVGIVFAAVSGFAQQIQLRLKIRQLEARLAQLNAGPVRTPVPAREPVGPREPVIAPPPPVVGEPVSRPERRI